MNKHRRMLAQITDYAKRHSVIDDGYNEVMACGDSLRRQMQRNERLLQVIHRMQQLKQSPMAVLKARLTVTPSGSRHAVEARKVMRKDGMLVLQTHDEQLPDGASRFSVYRLGTYHFKARLLAFNDFGKRTATDSAHVIDTRLAPAFPAAEGGAWVNSSGQLCGLHSGYGRVWPSAWPRCTVGLFGGGSMPRPFGANGRPMRHKSKVQRMLPEKKQRIPSFVRVSFRPTARSTKAVCVR